MSVIVLMVSIAFLGIHYYNGGTFDEVVPFVSIIVLLWMLDVIVHLHIISRPLRAIAGHSKNLDRASGTTKNG
jgi:hypothetical protein